jgi:AcrR family transcriptional regulator
MKAKKDSVRQNILSSAKQEFYECGYKDASLRNIASNANISVGNIYRYFPSKELLFDEIIGDVYKTTEKITKLKVNPSIDTLAKATGFTSKMVQYAIDLVVNNRFEIIILLNKSSGSKYEGAKTKLTEFAAKSIAASLEDNNYELAYLYASAALDTTIKIMEMYHDDEEKIKTLSLEFLNSLFSSSIFKVKEK